MKGNVLTAAVWTVATGRRRARPARCLRQLTCVAAFILCAPAFADSAGIRNDSSLSTISGQQVYTRICQGCHMPQGQGAVGAGHYPALARDPAIASAPYMARTILAGRRGMPAFALKSGGDSETESFIAPIGLSDAQVASVINYIRTHFGNAYKDRITTGAVKALHP